MALSYTPVFWDASSQPSSIRRACTVAVSSALGANGVGEGVGSSVGAGVSVGTGVLVGAGVSVGTGVLVGSVSGSLGMPSASSFHGASLRLIQPMVASPAMPST